MEALRKDIKAWLSDGSGFGSGFGSGDGSGYGSGEGYGSGDGYGYGDGSGSGFGYGYGYGEGYGSGYGYGEGYGSGDGYGEGYGSGYGYGEGYGSGDGYGEGYGSGDGFGGGIKTFDGKPVYMIDDTPTIIYKIRFGAAYGAILNSDLTLTKCWVCRGNGKFAHGETYKAAREALAEKLFDGMSEDERISEFWKCHNRTDRYNGRDLWTWHHRLTGSCEMGRNQFCADRGIDIDGTEWTVAEFVALCKDSYGGSTIKKLLTEKE